MKPLSELLDSRVLRVDLPSPAELCLTVSVTPRSSAVVMIWLGPSARGVGIVPRRPKGTSANAFVGKLRKELEGARLDSAQLVDGGELTLRFVRGEETPSLQVRWFRDGGHVTFRDTDGRAVVQHRSTRAVDSASGQQVRNVTVGTTLAELTTAGVTLAEGENSSDLTAARSALDRDLRRCADRALRRSRAIRDDIAKADTAPALRRDAELLTANLHSIPNHATTVDLSDWFTDPPTTRTLAIDPKLGPKGQAKALFDRAKRLDRGRLVALERLRMTDEEYDQLESLRAALASATTTTAIGEIETQALPILRAAAAPRTRAPKDSRAAVTDRLPYRIFHGGAGRPIWVGRSAKDNDALTLKHARPHHLWLHARGSAGSHVVVPLEKNESCPADLLVDAAHLAAHFSDLTGQDTAEVAYLARRHLRKPRGSAPGSVALTQEKVMRLRVDPERLARLLLTKEP